MKEERKLCDLKPYDKSSRVNDGAVEAVKDFGLVPILGAR